MCIEDGEAELGCECEYCIGWADGYNNGHVDGMRVPHHSKSSMLHPMNKPEKLDEESLVINFFIEHPLHYFSVIDIAKYLDIYKSIFPIVEGLVEVEVLQMELNLERRVPEFKLKNLDLCNKLLERVKCGCGKVAESELIAEASGWRWAEQSGEIQWTCTDCAVENYIGKMEES